MTTSMPSGDGTVPGSSPASGLDEDAAPAAGLDPDTPAEPAGQGRRPPDHTELDGPALENDEIRRATDDLQSSEVKSAAAREIVDELTAKTNPTGEPE